jgi:hypothetical protein
MKGFVSGLVAAVDLLVEGGDRAAGSCGAEVRDDRSSLRCKAVNVDQGDKGGALGSTAFLISCIMADRLRTSLCNDCISFECWMTPDRNIWKSLHSYLCSDCIESRSDWIDWMLDSSSARRIPFSFDAGVGTSSNISIMSKSLCGSM